MTTEFERAFADLRAILKRHGEGMVVQADTPSDFTLVTRAMAPKGQAMGFGCVLAKRSAVTYHLIPLYYNPKLQATIPAELLPRKQGKTCFNFRRPDAALFAALDALTARARDAFERAGFLEPGPVTPEKLSASLLRGWLNVISAACKKLRDSEIAGELFDTICRGAP